MQENQGPGNGSFFRRAFAGSRNDSPFRGFGQGEDRKRDESRGWDESLPEKEGEAELASRETSSWEPWPDVAVSSIQEPAAEDGGLTPDLASEFLRRTAATAVEEPPPEQETWLPVQPREVADVGLSKAFLVDLVLKIIHYSGNPSATQLVRRLGLGQSVVQELLSGLSDERLIEVMSQSDLYTGNYRYRLSERGTQRVGEALERTRYAGPAPVTAEQYSALVRRQMEEGRPASRQMIYEVLDQLVLSPQVADAIARALHSGKSTVLYGPSGNGKSTILESFAKRLEGAVLIPHAIYAHGQVIRVFDPSIHEPIDDLDNRNTSKDDSKLDRRWVLVRRPAVVLGAEIGAESLDLAYDPQNRFYQAPPHIKAQSGVLFVDDFGRQKIAAKELLTRWLIPFERGWDSLSLVTGEKVKLPFSAQFLLATNLDIRRLADEALLRRILYKVEVPAPSEEGLKEMMRRICEEKAVALADGALGYSVTRLYGHHRFRACASCARDLISMVQESALYDGREAVLDRESFEKVFTMFLLNESEEHAQDADRE